ncbi:DUF4177 domain-containing protein [Roseicyclus marinus]|uniref:DUF4177 domain-containing protein n=1 Tax=Roseicyclus marinus TaxID=2161673 RepID=UPI00240F98F4|nr:DUF4177 domain-containing protein [Roseicyclus marinus]MDG3042384.1 DUF4177 domain-containing protein [Roseicyclus marinus]
MPRYEYRLVPAPHRATKHKGLKGPENFAATLEDVLNAMGAEGWTYLRADILPEEVRRGLTSRATTYRTLLVFQRALPEEAVMPAAEVAARNTPVPPPVAEEADDAEEADLANLFALADEEDRAERDPKTSR